MDREDIRVPKRKKTVLTEDQYTKGIEAIIERDFFPDIPLLRHRLQSFEVKSNIGNSSAAGELFTSARPYSSKLAATPALRETSVVLETPVPVGKDSNDGITEVKQEEEKAENIPQQSLDAFLSQFTSEDNASFAELHEETLLRKRMKVNHLLEYNETESNEGYLLEWKFDPKNHLFYDSSVTGVAKMTEKEVANQVQGPPKQLCHENTRLPLGIVEEGLKPGKDYHLPGVGIVEKANTELLMTPTPIPGKNLSPIMTWGELAATPVRLDRTPGPGFTIKDASERDLIGRRMASHAKKSMQKRNAKFTPLSVRGTPQPTLSVAGKKLASQLQKRTPGTDLQLRATYSGTPRRQKQTTTQRTQTIAQATPLSDTKRKPSKSGILDQSNLTDNLLD